jgi:membrane-bound lytic murein transglycosylase F
LCEIPYPIEITPEKVSGRKKAVKNLTWTPMRRKGSGKKLAFFFLCILPLIFSCAREDALEKLKSSGEIRLLTRNNGHCYYTYRDEPMGFEYDLAKAFSEHLGVELKVVATTWEGLLEGLREGRGDFVAASMSITPSRAEKVDFSDEYLSVQQKVILHGRNNEIDKLEDLAGKTVHVRQGTSYEERLRELREEGLDIRIKTYNDTPTEELISMVADREIEVTVADSNVALLNRRYYPDVKIAFPIEEPESLGWAVKKGEKALLEEINRFFRKIRKEGVLSEIYEKYYANVELFDYLDLKKYHRRLETRLPAYREIIQKAARKYDLDWRLIAATIYQESHFDPKARSFTGVEGIMQLTRETAKEMGIEDRLDPEQSIMGGVKYLKNQCRARTHPGRPENRETEEP